MQVSEIQCREIFRLVKEEGYHPMDVVIQLGDIWGYKRNERHELFRAYAEYCDRLQQQELNYE